MLKNLDHMLLYDWTFLEYCHIFWDAIMVHICYYDLQISASPALTATHKVFILRPVIMSVDIHQVRFAFFIGRVQVPCHSSFHFSNLKSTKSFWKLAYILHQPWHFVNLSWWDKMSTHPRHGLDHRQKKTFHSILIYWTNNFSWLYMLRQECGELMGG